MTVRMFYLPYRALIIEEGEQNGEQNDHLIKMYFYPQKGMGDIENVGNSVDI